MNTYFQFKQFIINQDKCAMKVCTDACLFGAWVAEDLKSKIKNNSKILDIGAGTGLLSLMTAQKNFVPIDAIEIDTNAYHQAIENVNATKWRDQIKLINEDVLLYKTANKYDCIISNPPFFENQLKSNNAARNTAMHTDELSYEMLIETVVQNLAENGNFYVLLPFNAIENFEVLLNTKKRYISHQVNVSHSPVHPFFRVMLCVNNLNKETKIDKISIKNTEHIYSQTFSDLLKDYYLQF